MNWIQKFRDATSETKWFIFNFVVYTLIVIVTTVYCYARLDFVRSGPRPTPQQQYEKPNNE